MIRTCGWAGTLSLSSRRFSPSALPSVAIRPAALVNSVRSPSSHASRARLSMAALLARTDTLGQRRNKTAIQEFQQVLKLEPRSAPTRYQLAVAELQEGNPEQAKTDLKEAISIAPNLAEAVFLLAERTSK